MTREHTRLASFLSFSLSLCDICTLVLYEEEKEQKSEETFSPEFSFFKLTETRERETHTRDRNNTHVYYYSPRERETSEGKRERDVGPGDDQRSLLFLLRGKAVVEDQSPLARPGRGVRVFLVRDGTLCCSDAQACSFLFSALRSSLVFLFLFFFVL